jgi:hypothetical protein
MNLITPMTRALRIVVIALAFTLSACSPKTSELNPVVGTSTVTYKGLSFTKTKDSRRCGIPQSNFASPISNNHGVPHHLN